MLKEVKPPTITGAGIPIQNFEVQICGLEWAIDFSELLILPV